MNRSIIKYSFNALILVFLVRVEIYGHSIWISSNKLYMWLPYLIT